jgi:hypothetical protein
LPNIRSHCTLPVHVRILSLRSLRGQTMHRSKDR